MLMQLIALGHPLKEAKLYTPKQSTALITEGTLIEDLKSTMIASYHRVAFHASMEEFSKFIEGKERGLDGN